MTLACFFWHLLIKNSFKGRERRKRVVRVPLKEVKLEKIIRKKKPSFALGQCSDSPKDQYTTSNINAFSGQIPIHTLRNPTAMEDKKEPTISSVHLFLYRLININSWLLYECQNEGSLVIYPPPPPHL